MDFLDAAVDLLLQGTCPGCARPGRGVCPTCVRAMMAGRVGPRDRAGIDLPLWCAGDYEPPVPRVVSQAKDHHRWDGIEILGTRLAFAVAALADHLRLPPQGCLVPFPSTRASVEARGLDVTGAIVRAAARRLRRVGMDMEVSDMLVHVRRVQDQSGLTSDQRHANLEGALEARSHGCRGWIVLVDDVVTTGASMTEGLRALREAHLHPVGLGSVAATVLHNTSTADRGRHEGSP
ncbi:MAG: hypothetical protein FWD75_09410 [Propionibacteriaceae bacterium]|nr:hypothetical protein [Propionibacteriaceae bacterium]